MSHPTEAAEPEAPLHGYHGDRAEVGRRAGPSGATIALSREAGARGGTVARLVGRRLGWTVYDQEHLEFLSHDPVGRANLMDDLSPAAVAWFEARLTELGGPLNLGGDEPLRHLVRLMLSLGARGEAVILGRGAGHVLPRASTLNVRLIAPLAERVAYLSQWMRLTAEEAQAKVSEKDARREEFVRTRFGRSPADVHQYDVLLNTAELGEEGCAELIGQAAYGRWEQFNAARG